VNSKLLGNLSRGERKSGPGVNCDPCASSTHSCGAWGRARGGDNLSPGWGRAQSPSMPVILSFWGGDRKAVIGWGLGTSGPGPWFKSLSCTLGHPVSMGARYPGRGEWGWLTRDKVGALPQPESPLLPPAHLCWVCTSITREM
jgi:hypothetical protein